MLRELGYGSNVGWHVEVICGKIYMLHLWIPKGSDEAKHKYCRNVWYDGVALLEVVWLQIMADRNHVAYTAIQSDQDTLIH
jgi:hypothetical protein